MSSIALLELHARERLGNIVNWYAYAFEVIHNPATNEAICYKVEGGCCPLLTKGPRQGRPNFTKLLPGTQKTLHITIDDQEAWEVAWEARKGHCRVCMGAGVTLLRWSRYEGSVMQPCKACGGVATVVPPREPGLAAQEVLL